MLSEVNAHIVARGQPTLAGRFVHEPFDRNEVGSGLGSDGRAPFGPQPGLWKPTTWLDLAM